MKVGDRKAYQKKHYQENKEQYSERNKRNKKKRTKENTQYRREVLQQNPCVDCGEKDPCLLEFDHVRGIKKYNLSRMWTTGYSLDKIKEELKKCDIRCANCHRKKTATEKGWYAESKK
jgi:hypothetical protein